MAFKRNRYHQGDVVARNSEYYRRYAQELRAIADWRRTYEGNVATLELATTYDKMADQMAEAEKNLGANDQLPETSIKPKIK